LCLAVDPKAAVRATCASCGQENPEGAGLVREKLLQLARSHGRVRDDGVRIALPLTHELLSRTVGSSRETVTLAMRELRREGFLDRSGRSYLLRIAAHDLDAHAGAFEAASAA
jgi:hypothetical protein